MNVRGKLGWLAGLAAAATVLVGVPPADAAPSYVSATAPLSDLSSAANATDGGYGRLYAVAPGDGNTYFVLVLTGLDPDAAGTTYGAHVHVGPCVAGNGAAALGHYNTGTGGPPSRQNEVWLDFTVRPGGVGVAYATAPFEIEPGTARSVVVHALPTEPGTGIAGGRIACLPVNF
jgi:Cu/Zn superoxide dismutase